MKLLPKRDAFAFLVSMVTISTLSYAQTSPEVDHCVRIYCKKDVSTKVRDDETGHGSFAAAYYDKKTNTYLVDPIVMASAVVDCRVHYNMKIPLDVKTLPGTDASKFEKIAPWIVIRPDPKPNGKLFATGYDRHWMEVCEPLMKKDK